MPTQKEWEDFLRQRGLLPFAVEQLGWHVSEGKLFIEYPAIEELGIPETSRYRPKPDKKPRFKKGQVPTPYFLRNDEDNVLIIVEGETDSATVAGAGFSVLGIPGATNWRKEYWLLAKDYEKVIVFSDCNEAGANLLITLANTKPENVELHISPPALLKTNATDINDIHQQNNGEFEKTAQTIETLIEMAHPLETTTSQEQFLKAICSRLEGVTKPENEDRKALCIFHEEKTSSLDFGPKGFTCFACGKHGSLKLLGAMLGVVLTGSQSEPVKYVIHKGKICSIKPTEDGIQYIPLCNFHAKITKGITRDDGINRSLFFEINGALASGKNFPKILIPSDKFRNLGWVISEWGAEANIEPGSSINEKLRSAIQNLSGDIEQKTLYTHTGWRNINGTLAYLHKGGAIGLKNVAVEPDIESLRMYNITEEPTNAKATLDLLEIGPSEIMIPLIAATYRAPTCCLKYPSVLLWLYGKTQSLKSTIAALMLNHYGADFSDENLPGGWQDTDNALEKAISMAHDVPFVIDDYAPQDSKRSADELKKKAARIIREVGNRQARARLKSDTSGRPEYLPNSLVMSTAELPPSDVQSINARTLLLDFSGVEFDMEKLTEAQMNRRKLMGAMHGFINWLAPQMKELKKYIEDRTIELRGKVGINEQKRIATGAIHIFLGWEMFLQYAFDGGVISQEEQKTLWEQGWQVFINLANQVKNNVEENDPVNIFFETINRLLIQGSVYLDDKKTGQSISYKQSENRLSNAKLIGWVDESYLYLMPEASMAEVIKALREMNMEFPMSNMKSFGDMLDSKKLIVAKDNGKKTKQIRIRDYEKRQRVWQLPLSILN